MKRVSYHLCGPSISVHLTDSTLQEAIDRAKDHLQEFQRARCVDIKTDDETVATVWKSGQVDYLPPAFRAS